MINSKILTLRGWVDASKVVPGMDFVYTHKHRWVEVKAKYETFFDEGVLAKTTTSLKTLLTPDLTLKYNSDDKLIVPRIRVNNASKHTVYDWEERGWDVITSAFESNYIPLTSNLLQQEGVKLKAFIKPLLQMYTHLNTDQKLFVATAIIKLDKELVSKVRYTEPVKFKEAKTVYLFDNEDGSWFLNGLCVTGE